MPEQEHKAFLEYMAEQDKLDIDEPEFPPDPTEEEIDNLPF
jgi:hypothetical protein